ncbi:hypothetical protein LOS78_01950 [Paracoccus sp. MA]|uniref:hypothetical protein n=1 Tax=Paracoccus sp. MA TaxID=2895796 RepID=UPI001E2DAF88|nr:hypothetical protein [Paracoccus sp. MA]UFM64263.1 hypothetical protein LOS78_01950 [Paracoccus sp. MA]
MQLRPLNCRLMAYDATPEDLIAEELSVAIPGSEVKGMRHLGLDRWMVDVRKTRHEKPITVWVQTSVVDDTFLQIQIVDQPSLAGL